MVDLLFAQTFAAFQNKRSIRNPASQDHPAEYVFAAVDETDRRCNPTAANHAERHPLAGLGIPAREVCLQLLDAS